MLSQRAIENRLFGSTASVEPFWGGLRALHPRKGRKNGVKSSPPGLTKGIRSHPPARHGSHSRGTSANRSSAATRPRTPPRWAPSGRATADARDRRENQKAGETCSDFKIWPLTSISTPDLETNTRGTRASTRYLKVLCTTLQSPARRREDRPPERSGYCPPP